MAGLVHTIYNRRNAMVEWGYTNNSKLICMNMNNVIGVRLTSLPPTHADKVALPAFARRCCSKGSISPARRAHSCKPVAAGLLGPCWDRQTDGPCPTQYWRRGVVVSGVRRMNEVNARRTRLVPGRVTVFGRVYHLGM